MLLEKIRKIKSNINDPLYRSSLCIMGGWNINGLSGLIFWVIAAKLYSVDDIGSAASAISALLLISLISRLGLDYALIHFFPENEKTLIFSMTFWIITFSSVIFGLLFIFGIDYFSPKLGFLKTPIVAGIFLLFLVSIGIFNLIGNVFLALKKSRYYLIQNLLMSFKIVLIIPFLMLDSFGIVIGLGISYIIANIFSIYILAKSKLVFKPRYNINLLKDEINYSISNYFAILLQTTPSFIIPIMILNQLNAENSGCYYMIYALSSAIYIIPNAISISLYVEGSEELDIISKIIPIIKNNFFILIPLIVLSMIFDPIILNIINIRYANLGIFLLYLMLLSSIPLSINYIFLSIIRIKKDNKLLFIYSGITFSLLMVMTHEFLKMYGLIGVGYAWLLSYGISSILILLVTIQASYRQKKGSYTNLLANTRRQIRVIINLFSTNR